MKRIISIAIMLMAIYSMMAQEQSHEGKKPVYCNVMGYNAFGFGKIKVVIDLGRKSNAKFPDCIYNEDGKKQKFNSMMEVLDFMGERGWVFKQAISLSSGSKSDVYHFILEKWVEKNEEKFEGLILREEAEEPYSEDYVM